MAAQQGTLSPDPAIVACGNLLPLPGPGGSPTQKRRQAAALHSAAGRARLRADQGGRLAVHMPLDLAVLWPYQ